MTSLAFIAEDGSWGDASGLTIMNMTNMPSHAYEQMDAETFGALIATAEENGAERMRVVCMTEDEYAIVVNTLQNAIALLINDRRPGLAEEISDVIDVLKREV